MKQWKIRKTNCQLQKCNINAENTWRAPSHEIKASALFFFRLDKFTIANSCSQVLVFVIYIHLEDIEEQFVFCRELKPTMKGEDVIQMLKSFFENNDSQWKTLCGVCTVGAPAMLGSCLGFQSVLSLYPKQKHCPAWFTNLALLPRLFHCICRRCLTLWWQLPIIKNIVLPILVCSWNYMQKHEICSKKISFLHCYFFVFKRSCCYLNL